MPADAPSAALPGPPECVRQLGSAQSHQHDSRAHHHHRQRQFDVPIGDAGRPSADTSPVKTAMPSPRRITRRNQRYQSDPAADRLRVRRHGQHQRKGRHLGHQIVDLLAADQAEAQQRSACPDQQESHLRRHWRFATSRPMPGPSPRATDTAATGPETSRTAGHAQRIPPIRPALCRHRMSLRYSASPNTSAGPSQSRTRASATRTAGPDLANRPDGAVARPLAVATTASPAPPAHVPSKMTGPLAKRRKLPAAAPARRIRPPRWRHRHRPQRRNRPRRCQRQQGVEHRGRTRRPETLRW